MKTQLKIGMMILVSATMFSQITMAAPAKMTSREALAEYSAKVKETAFGKDVKNAKGLNAVVMKQAQDKLVNWLKLDGTMSNKMSQALNADSDKRPQRLESLATIIAAKEMIKANSITDAAEAKSIESAADASAKLIVHARLTGKMPAAQVKELNTVELADTTSALQKLESLPESILTSFNGKERDSYVEILTRHDELMNSSAKSSEENFVQAIMEVKKVNKDKALETVRKLKECV